MTDDFIIRNIPFPKEEKELLEFMEAEEKKARSSLGIPAEFFTAQFG